MAAKSSGGTITEISKKHSESAEQMRWSTSKESIQLSSGQSINAYGADGGIKLAKNDPVSPPQDVQADFSISLAQGREKTFVPLGIPAYSGDMEYPYFFFNYTLTGTPVGSLTFEIADEAGNILYDTQQLPPLIIRASAEPALLKELGKQQPIDSWVPADIVQPFLYTDYMKPGSYTLLWDGFNNAGIYDSIVLNGKELTARITATGKSDSKTEEVRFTPSAKADWADIKIDKNANRIDVTLRVNFKDGREKGLSSGNDVPTYAITYNGGQQPLQVRTKTFDDLKQLSQRGLSWTLAKN